MFALKESKVTEASLSEHSRKWEIYFAFSVTNMLCYYIYMNICSFTKQLK